MWGSGAIRRVPLPNKTTGQIRKIHILVTGSQQPAQPRLAYTPVGLDGFRSLTRWDPRIPGLRYAALGLTHLTGLDGFRFQTDLSGKT